MTNTQALCYAQPRFAGRTWINSYWATALSMIMADLITLSAVYWLAVIGRYLFYPNYDLSFYSGLYPVIGIFIGVFYVQNLYPGILLHPAEEIKRVFKCMTVVLLVLALGTFLGRTGEAYSRSIFLMMWAAGAPSIIFMRHLARSVLSRQSWWGISAIIIGQGPCAERVIGNLAKRNGGLHVAGILTDDLNHFVKRGMPPVLGSLCAAQHLAQNRVAEYVVVAMPEKTNAELRYIIQHFCRGFRHVLLVPDLPGICSLEIVAHELGGEVGLEIPQSLSHTSANISKRVFDIVLSALLMMALSPLFIVVAVFTRLTSKGPIFFGHRRYGQAGKTFKALKFRTMVMNADQVLNKYLETSPDQKAEWDKGQKLQQDPRVTGIGRILRRYSLDELPQLINVLLGQMSLVGPRPIVKNEILKYGAGFELYTRVPPGITGLWQVSGRNNTSYAERVGYDEYYVRNWSIWLDLYILTKTVKTVVTAEGAY